MYSKIALGVSELSAAENSKVVMVPVTRTGDLQVPTTVRYATTSDSATAGSDYIERSGTIVMGPGVDHVMVPIRLIDDRSHERTESFTFCITSVDNGTLEAPRTTQVKILDDENKTNEIRNPSLASKYTVIEDDVVSGLEAPISLAFSKTGENLSYIAEKGGKIKVYDMSSGAFVSTFIDISDKVNSDSDRGLMDIALDPDFANKPYVYAFYVVDPPDTADHSGNAGPDGGGNRFSYVVRFTADPATGYTTAIAGSEKILVGGTGKTLADISGNGAIDSTRLTDFPDSSVLDSSDLTNLIYKDDYLKVDSHSHAGGSLAFGPDGALYVSVGDGATYNVVSPQTSSVQDLDSLSGKILRIDPDTGQGLGDNPFVTAGLSLDSNRSKVYQLGLRNPFSISFDTNGSLLISDTGWSTYEEINIGAPGANFGWPYFEGDEHGVPQPTRHFKNLPSAKAFYEAVRQGEIYVTPAFRAFAHVDEMPGYQIQAITAGNVDYTGSRYPVEFSHNYFFSDFAEGEIYTIDINDRSNVKFLYKSDSQFAPVDFTQGPDGYVYYVDIINGQIGRLLIERSNYIPGSLHAEKMYGGRGNNTYVVNDKSDKVIETVGQGVDTIKASVGFTLPANVERLKLVGSADLDAIGNPLSNVLVGNAGDNVLRGLRGSDVLFAGDGHDTLIGGIGDDIYYIAQADDRVVERPGQGHDKIKTAISYTLAEASNVEVLQLLGTKAINATGSIGNDVLIGNAGGNIIGGGLGNDKLTGGGGSDDLIGGRGHDVLTGGAHADTFVLKSLSDSTVAASGRDLIRDFHHAQRDHIDLHLIDANTHAMGNQAFHFIGDNAFRGHAGELQARDCGSNTLVSGDVNGDGKADFSILLHGDVALQNGDFLL